MRRQWAPPSKRLSTRSGVAALLVLVCLSFATVVATLLVQAALAERTYANRIELIYQTDWVVEAGIARAAAQLSRSPSYDGETWHVSLQRSDRPLNAVVHIEVKRTADAQTRLVRVKAETRGEGLTQLDSQKEITVSVNGPSRD